MTWADEETTFYMTPEERRTAVADAERRGLTMKHDEYGVGAVTVQAADAIRADPENGIEPVAAIAEVRENRLTFGLRTDPPELAADRRKGLRTALAKGTASNAEIQEALALLL